MIYKHCENYIYVKNMNELEFIKKCRDDIVFFAEHVLRAEDGGFYKLEPHQRAMVTSKEGQVVYFCGRRLGKSFMLATEAIHRALFQKYQKVFVLSPTENQAKELAETITGMIERSALVEQEVKLNNVMEKKFYNGSRIVIRTGGGRGSVSSIIGSGAHLLIIDEIQDVSDELISRIIPVMRGQQGAAKFIVAGTPRDRSGFLYESLENAPRIWDDGEWYEFPENRGNFTVYRQQTCYMDEDENIIRSSTPRITIEELKEDYENIPRLQFLQEYCLDFMSSVSDVYSEELREQVLYHPDKEYGFGSHNPVVAGLDIGKMRNETVLYIAEVVPKPKVENKSYKILDLKWVKEFPLGTEYTDIEDYLSYELPKLFPNLFRIVVDETGVGLAVCEVLQKRAKKTRAKYIVEPFKFSKERKKDLVESGVAALERGQAKIVWNKRLEHEMRGYKRELTDSNNYVYQKTAGSDDYVDAMNLCLYNIALGLISSVPIGFQVVPKLLPKQFGQHHDSNDFAPKKQKPRRRISNSKRRRF